LRGLRISFLVLDEYKDMRPDLLDTVLPALTDFDAPLLVIGTPADTEGHYTQLSRESQVDPLWRYFERPSSTNPFLKPEVLEREKRRLVSRGDEDTWIREYEAKFVPGGKRAIFPMLTKERHVRPYAYLKYEILQRPNAWRFIVALDPGTASTFAGVLGAVNSYTGQVRILDEIYAQSQAETSIGVIYPRIQQKMKELWDEDEDWTTVADCAASWAINELFHQFGVTAWPSDKEQNKKADGLGLIKDLLNSDSLLISDRCEKLFWEATNYTLNKQGQPVKANDHALDSLRYLLGISHMSIFDRGPLPPAPLPVDNTPLREPRRAWTPQEDMANMHASLWHDAGNYLMDELDDSDY
jgi:hypothetical protein